MYRRLRLYTPVIVALMALCAVLTLLSALFSITLFYICVSLTLIVLTAVLVMLRRTGAMTRAMLREIERGIIETGEGGFTNFPMPVITVYENSEIIWCNELCTSLVFEGHDTRGKDIAQVLPGLDVTVPSPPEGYDIAIGSKEYTAYVSRTVRGGGDISVIYLINDTSLKHFASEYHLTRPSVVTVAVDSYDELTQDLRESERGQIMSRIESAIEQYFTDNAGFILRIQRDRFFAVVEERGMRSIIDSKFDILDRVRAIHVGDRMNATLSIGVGREAKNLAEAEALSRQALDMCQGRGGDQAAIKTQSGYEFYGGVSKGVEKRTKVKTRIIATALAELVGSASNVIVMSHRFADLDALGSGIGILKSVRAMGKPGVICIDKQKNLVEPLIARLYANGYSEGDFVSPEDALPMVGEKTLLIVVDTHIPLVLESEKLYRSCKNVVVIDHHRKLVHYIDNAVIFYHEPYASSTSEMVTELMQYFPVRPQVSKLEAEALLSGIMLDTKNFVLRTGVRTFEAAAYLRRLGADTVEVRKLFASTMDSYQQKASLVSNAEIYRGCAIASSDFAFDGVKVIAPQAADELMTIAGVEASFVVFSTDNSVNVSARSLGAVNVQLIMERMGGGGHHTMAAAQFPGESMENVRKMVMEAIDDYFANRSDAHDYETGESK